MAVEHVTKNTLQRASLEMSLKPFKNLDPSAIDEVCTEALRLPRGSYLSRGNYRSNRSTLVSVKRGR